MACEKLNKDGRDVRCQQYDFGYYPAGDFVDNLVALSIIFKYFQYLYIKCNINALLNLLIETQLTKLIVYYCSQAET